MIDLLKIIAGVFLPILMQTLYLSYRFGRIEERVADHSARIRRIEDVQDRQFVKER